MDATIDAVVNADTHRVAPRVVFITLASCFGCQINVTNVERYLMDVVGQLDLQYWQLTSSSPMPDDYDVAVIEGAITTREAITVVERARATAKTVILIGACASTAGIPGIAARDFAGRETAVYGNADTLPEACGQVIAPRPVSSVIKPDYVVYGCPVDTMDFIDVLYQALMGSNRFPKSVTLCGECKQNGTTCFYQRGQLCMGLVTRAGCRAKCVNLGRACMGCRGLSPDANLDEARAFVVDKGFSLQDFNARLELFNQVDERVNPQVSAQVQDAEGGAR